MAKRKLTSLRTVLLRYLLLCGGGCALILVLWWIIFMQLINIGFLLPAVASAQACSEARETVAAVTAETFDSNQISDLCRWAVVQNDTVLQTNMTARQLKIALNAFHGGSGNLGYTQYQYDVKMADGSFAFCSTTMLCPTPTRLCGTRCRISRPATCFCWRCWSSHGWAGRPTAPCGSLPPRPPVCTARWMPSLRSSPSALTQTARVCESFRHAACDADDGPRTDRQPAKPMADGAAARRADRRADA